MWLGLVMYDLKWMLVRYAHIWSRITHRTTFSSKTNTLETLRATRSSKKTRFVELWVPQHQFQSSTQHNNVILLSSWHCGKGGVTFRWFTVFICPPHEKTKFATRFNFLVARNVSGVFVLLEKVVRCVILDQIFAYLSRDHLRLNIWTLYTRRDPDVRWTHS